MRAAVVEVCGTVPRTLQRPVPEPGPAEVLVAVDAAPITPLDVLCAGGASYFGQPETPYIPGVQGVGRIGGRPVWFPTSAGMKSGDGSLAEFAVVAESDLVDLPPGVDPVAVAAAGLSAVAALVATLWRGGLQPGEMVVVLGGGGVVGQAAIQFARRAGAGRIVAAVRSDLAVERARSAGADVVIRLDTDPQALAAAFLKATDASADLVVDPLFGAPAAAAARILKPGGRLVNLGSSASETSPLDSGTIRSRSLRVIGYTNNELTRQERSAAMREVAACVAGGTLSVSREVASLDDVGQAWARQADGTAGGRIVVRP